MTTCFRAGGRAGCNYPFLTSYERDNETGLDYSINRYYSNVQGRFTSPDLPFADQWEVDPQSWNLYSYVGNQPLNSTDPLGLWHRVDCDNGGVCWQADDGDTWESFSKETGYSRIGLEKFFAGQTITSGQVFDVGGFEAWTRSFDNKFLGDFLRHRLPEFEPAVGGGLRNVAKAGPGLISKLGSWLGLGKTAQSAAARNIGGITAAQAARLRELLEKIPGAVKVRAFGSRTTGAFTQNSDLDIAILGNVDKSNPNTLRAVQEAQRYAESIGIGMGKGYRPLDINVYKSVQEMHQAFRNNPLFDAARGLPKLVGIE